MLSILAVLYLFLTATVKASEYDSQVAELVECLGDEYFKYNISRDGEDGVMLISRYDDLPIDYSDADKTLWNCTKDKVDWSYAIYNLDDISDQIEEEYRQTEEFQSNYVIANGTTDQFLLSKRKNDNYGLVGHDGDNCGGSIKWTFDIDTSSKCHKPKVKSRSTKLYNHTKQQATFKLWPHHNCQKGDATTYKIQGNKDSCAHRDCLSFTAKK